MSNPSPLDYHKFSAKLKTKRAGRGLRVVAEEIGGVSASTLSRIEQGNVPDLETFMRICRWLGVSADEFQPARDQSCLSDSPETEEVIEAHLRADRTLPVEAVNALSQMIRFAYKAARNGNLKGQEE